MHNPDIPSFPVVHFQTDVYPVISGNCSVPGCHDSGGSRVFSLAGYDQIISIVIAGDAQNSRLYTSISNHNFNTPMPPSHPLPDVAIKLIYLWIEQGAKNN